MDGIPAPPADLPDRPADRVRLLAELTSVADVARWCAGVLDGTVARDDPVLVRWLAGRGAQPETWLRRPANAYWPRVWALRGLLHVWADDATPAVVLALRDEHWRGRELAAKVVAAHDVGPAVDALPLLLDDEVPRVRAAAARALAAVGEHEHLDAVTDLLDDPDPHVQQAAARAVRRLRDRLDLP